jgi:hypothetical protein
MRHKRILKLTLLSLVAIAGMVVANPMTTSAFAPKPPTTIMAAINCPQGQVHPKDWNGDIDNNSCCPGTGNPTAMQCLLSKYINPVVNLLAAGLGVIVVASVISGGIQYSSAGGDPGKVAAAKGRIANSLLALAGFVFLYAFLQWVIPGGLL